MTTLVDVLRDHASDSPDHRIFTFLGPDLEPAGERTYGDLDRRAREISGALQGLRGERALVVFAPGLAFVEALYGCLYAGLIAVPCPPPDPGRKHAGPRMQTIVADATPQVVISLSELEPSIREVLGAQTPRFVATDAPAEDAAGPGAAQPDDLAVLQYTSGSTAVPRGVMVSHANILDNCDFIAEGMELERDAGGLMWLPPYHDMGLVGGMFSPVHSGRPMTLMSPLTFLVDPLNWLRAITRHRPSASGGPNFAFDLCVRRSTPEQRDGLDLSSWQTAYNGAEPVRAETMDEFAEAFAPFGFEAAAFYPCYGLAEATLMVSGADKGAAPEPLAADLGELERGRFVSPAEGGRSALLVSCGSPRAGARVRIVDHETLEPKTDDEIGEIWVAGPSVGAGYWAREAETTATFEAALADDEGPFLRTGDFGFMHEGELYVTGRIQEILVVDDRALYPADVERAAEAAVPALRHNCSAAFLIETGGRRRLALVAEVREEASDLDAAYAAIREAISGAFGLQVGAICLIEPRTISRTSSGKTQRNRCRELFLRGALNAVGEWLDTGAQQPAASPPPDQ